MPKSTPAGIERDLNSSLNSFKARAAAVKEAHLAARRDLLNDPMTSDLAKKDHLATLDKETKGKLSAIKGEQETYVKSLRDKVETELRGTQPTDANSVLLRRDAADRARRIADEREALEVLNDAARNGDDSLAHAVGYRARQSGWVDASDAYRESQPDSADAASALATVEEVTSGPAYNVSNSITYSPPLA